MCARNKNYLSEPTKRPCNNRDHILSWQTNYCFWFLSSSSVCLYVVKLCQFHLFSTYKKAGKICRSWYAAWANPGKIAGTDPQSQRSRSVYHSDITLYYIKIYNKNTVNIKGELLFSPRVWIRSIGERKITLTCNKGCFF